MQNLQAAAETGGFEVEFAQAAALVHLVADEQLLAVEAAADRLEIGVNRQGCQLWKRLPALTDARRQGIHQGVHPTGTGGTRGS